VSIEGTVESYVYWLDWEGVQRESLIVRVPDGGIAAEDYEPVTDLPGGSFVDSPMMAGYVRSHHVASAMMRLLSLGTLEWDGKVLSCAGAFDVEVNDEVAALIDEIATDFPPGFWPFQ